MITLRRAVNQKVRAKMNPYVTALGRVAHSWNYLQESLGQLFCTVTGLDERVGQAIWHSTSSDRAQREMLSAATSTSLDRRLTTDYPKAKEDIKWLLDRANKVADQRNDAIHAPISISIGQSEFEIVPASYYGNPRAKKLVWKDIIAEFKWYELSADALTRFARAVRTAIQSDTFPWPDKPQMPTLQPRKNRKARRRKNTGK
jgi:hypothetical protein